MSPWSEPVGNGVGGPEKRTSFLLSGRHPIHVTPASTPWSPVVTVPPKA